MDGVLVGGKRRIDRVLAEDFLADLDQLGLVDVRSLRDEARQEETDLSYLRRLLQGRIDIVTAELDRRAGDAPEPVAEGENPHVVVADLPDLLGDAPRPPARGMGRFQPVEPTNAGETRRREEQLAALDVTRIGTQSDDELRTLLDELREAESSVSARRRAVQEVYDSASAEIARRYREGQANVDELLREESGA